MRLEINFRLFGNLIQVFHKKKEVVTSNCLIQLPFKYC